MVKAADLKFYIDDDLEAVLKRVKQLEDDVSENVSRRKDKQRLMKALLEVEDGIHKAKRVLGSQ